jgi:hypothetical protein
MFDLTYSLDNHGCANFAVSNGEPSLQISASYLSDALGDFARAARGVLRGMLEVAFQFVCEPGQHRFVIARRDEDILIQIFYLPREFAVRLNKAELVLTAAADVRSFANVAINCLRRVLDEHGEEGYRRRWKNHEFPRQELADLLELRRELAAQRSTK